MQLNEVSKEECCVWGFGFNAFGQVDGVGGVEKQVIESPCKVVPFHDMAGNVVKISSSWTSTFFLINDGSVSIVGWIPGRDSNGYKQRLFPDLACTDVECGLSRAAFVTDTGDCILWDDYTGVDTASFVLSTEETITTICTGDLHTIAKTGNGNVMLATNASQYQSEEHSELHFHTLQIPWKVNSVCCGKEHVILLDNNGQVLTYGGGSRGQLGHGAPDGESHPRVVEAVAGIRITHISTGGWHSAIISDTGDLYVWGWNESGQVGVSSSVDTSQVTVQCQMEPVPLVLDPQDEESTVLSVSCGARHTAAVSSDGKVWTWGWGHYGQLGHGDRKRRTKPIPVEIGDTSADRPNRVVDVYCGHWTTFVVVRNTR